MTENKIINDLDQIIKITLSVDRTSVDAVFDCLAEIELLTRDSVANHSMGQLLKTMTNYGDMKSSSKKAA